jgi:hypothetical protein
MRLSISALIAALCACGSVNNAKPDAQVTPQADACVPESDDQICTRLATACEAQMTTDNCGMPREVDCGACSGGQGCVVGTCQTPVCSSFNYTRSTITAFSQTNIEDSIGGATWDGRVVLYVKTVGGVCQNFRLIMADELTPGSGSYTQTDATTNFQTLGLLVGQEAYAAMADGLTLVAMTTNRKQLVTTTRSALGAVDFGAPSTAIFDPINATVSATGTAVFTSPTISKDGLEFFYTLSGYTGGDVAKNGVYNSVRSSTSAPFPAGTKMPAPLNEGSYGSVTGVSSDRLAVFVFWGYTSRVLTRRSTSAPFTNPNAPGDPPSLEGWSHKALDDCSKLIGMYSPGGCQNEDVILLTRQ